MKHGQEQIPQALWLDVEMLRRRSDRLSAHEIPGYIDVAAQELIGRAHDIGVFWSEQCFVDEILTPDEDITYTRVFTDGQGKDEEERSPFARFVTMSWAPDAIVPIVGQIVVARRNSAIGCAFTTQLTVDGLIKKPQVNLANPSVIVSYQRPEPMPHTLRWEWMSDMNATVFSYELEDGKRHGLGTSTSGPRRIWPSFVETYYADVLQSLSSEEAGYGLMRRLVRITTPLLTPGEFQEYVDGVLRVGL